MEEKTWGLTGGALLLTRCVCGVAEEGGGGREEGLGGRGWEGSGSWRQKLPPHDQKVT